MAANNRSVGFFYFTLSN